MARRHDWAMLGNGPERSIRLHDDNVLDSIWSGAAHWSACGRGQRERITRRLDAPPQIWHSRRTEARREIGEQTIVSTAPPHNGDINITRNESDNPVVAGMTIPWTMAPVVWPRSGPFNPATLIAGHEKESRPIAVDHVGGHDQA